MSEPEHPLHRARVAAGLDQETLAGLSGVSQPTISRIEGGQAPSTATALRIARALNVPVEELFGHLAPTAPSEPTEAA